MNHVKYNLTTGQAQSDNNEGHKKKKEEDLKYNEHYGVASK